MANESVLCLPSTYSKSVQTELSCHRPRRCALWHLYLSLYLRRQPVTLVPMEGRQPWCMHFGLTSMLWTSTSSAPNSSHYPWTQITSQARHARSWIVVTHVTSNVRRLTHWNKTPFAKVEVGSDSHRPSLLGDARANAPLSCLRNCWPPHRNLWQIKDPRPQGGSSLAV
ncbi:hypothetical protein BDZ97DRAFT_1837024 [Flammula alnicola]|nr:hypothetical protein BDZ97DRAFT_1837024 [Flammula alnicola]